MRSCVERTLFTDLLCGRRREEGCFWRFGYHCSGLGFGNWGMFIFTSRAYGPRLSTSTYTFFTRYWRFRWEGYHIFSFESTIFISPDLPFFSCFLLFPGFISHYPPPFTSSTTIIQDPSTSRSTRFFRNFPPTLHPILSYLPYISIFFHYPRHFRERRTRPVIYVSPEGREIWVC